MIGYVYVAVTVGLTVLGQLLMKWQMGQVGPLPASAQQKIIFLFFLCFRPAAFSALLCAYLGALSWMAALTRLPVSTAYPCTAMSYVLVMVCGWVLFDEMMSMTKIAGLTMIVVGIWLAARN